MLLQNRVNKKELKKRIQEETLKRITVSFYRYVIIDNPQELRDSLFLQWNALKILGRIYVAKEGINAQMCVPEENWEIFKYNLDQHPLFSNMPLKIAVEDDGKSFYKLTIKVRAKIVADGLDDNAFDVTNVGNHLTAKEFNAAMENPDEPAHLPLPLRQGGHAVHRHRRTGGEQQRGQSGSCTKTMRGKRG